MRRLIMSSLRSAAAFKTGLLTVALCALTVPAHAELLGQAVESALNHHPSVEAAIANRDAFTAERKEQWADHFPSLNVRGTGGRVYGDNSTSRGLTVTRGAAYSYLWEGSVTVTQPIFDGFETFNRVDAAEMRTESATYEIVDVRENLALRTVLAYLDVLRGRETLAKIKAHSDKLADYQGRIQKMVDEGAADKSMIVQAQDIKAQLDNTMTDIEGQLKTANADYLELTGHLPEDPMETPEFHADMMPPEADAGVTDALGSHLSLKAVASTTQALAYDAAAEKQFYYPDVSGELSYLERDQVDEIGGEAVDAKAVVRLNWDLSVAGGQAARVKKSLYREHESKAKQAETQRQVEHDVRVAYNDLTTSQDRVKIQQDRVKINEDLFANYNAQFEAARVNLLQLLQSDNALFNASLALLNGEYKLLASQFAVLASMGKLQESLNVVSAANNEN